MEGKLQSTSGRNLVSGQLLRGLYLDLFAVCASGRSWTYPNGRRNICLQEAFDVFSQGRGARYRYDAGNEPGFLSPYLYNWIGSQSSTAKTIRAILPASYHTGLRGLPGNDDSGAMGSFLVFNQMGFFPVAAQNVYLIGSPTFLGRPLLLANGKTFSVAARNSSPRNVYIANAVWNGKPYNRSWFTHDH